MSSNEDTSVRRSTKHAPREKLEISKNKPGIVVGVISEKHGVAWVVSPHRTDKKTGAQQKKPAGRYARELMQSVTLGNVRWDKVFKPSTLIIVRTPNAVKDQIKSYCLNYATPRKGSMYPESQYVYFTSENDDEAWQYANQHMLLAGVNQTNMRQAILFQEEREVKRVYTKAAQS